MTDTRPRHYAFKLLADLRVFCSEWMDRNEVPKEHRRLVLRHVANAVIKSLARKQK